jgi:hypothetical protein
MVYVYQFLMWCTATGWIIFKKSTVKRLKVKICKITLYHWRWIMCMRKMWMWWHLYHYHLVCVCVCVCGGHIKYQISNNTKLTRLHTMQDWIWHARELARGRARTHAGRTRAHTHTHTQNGINMDAIVSTFSTCTWCNISDSDFTCFNFHSFH